MALVCLAGGTRVDAAPRCVVKMADGTGPTEKVAKFQVYEGLLKSVDWGAWSQWMLDGSTPGWRVGRPVYVCRTGTGLGVSCRGKATLCKT
jgi:hypothetical protein